MANDDLVTRMKLMQEDLASLQQFRIKYHELASQHDKLKIQCERQNNQKIEKSVVENSMEELKRSGLV